MSLRSNNAINKYLNRKGEYCPFKSESVRKEYLFQRQMAPRLAKRKTIKDEIQAAKKQTYCNSEKIMVAFFS